jgi:hypothetical protein
VTDTSALVTVTPPPGGCTPVSYEVGHRRTNSLDAPSRTAVPAGGLTARLGNLATGQTYEAIVVGTCADGTRTPPSAPARFTARAPTCCPAGALEYWGGCFSATAGSPYGLVESDYTLVNLTVAITGAAPGAAITCYASDVGATVASWATWAGVLATPECNGTNPCGDNQTLIATGVAAADGTASIDLSANTYIAGGDGFENVLSVVCAADAAAPACPPPATPQIATVTVSLTCFPADAVVQRIDPATGAAAPARMDELAIGDVLPCMVPQINATHEAGYTRSVCQVYYYLNKALPLFTYYHMSYLTLDSRPAVFRASPHHSVFVAGAAAGPAAAPPPGAARQSKHVRMGDLLAIQDPFTGLFYTAAVTAIETTRNEGAYTPLLTDGGMPIVDGVLAYTVAGREHPLKQSAFWWMHAPVWQLLAPNASDCGRASCPCLDAACVRKGDALRSVPGGFSQWFADFYLAMVAARMQGRDQINYHAIITDVRALVGNGTALTQSAALALFDSHYTAALPRPGRIPSSGRAAGDVPTCSVRDIPTFSSARSVSVSIQTSGARF